MFDSPKTEWFVTLYTRERRERTSYSSRDMESRECVAYEEWV